MTTRDDDVAEFPPDCPHCGARFRLATAESTRYYVCPECRLVRLIPFAAYSPAAFEPWISRG